MSRPKTIEDLTTELSVALTLHDDPATDIVDHLKTAERLLSVAVLSFSEGQLDHAFLQFARCFHIMDHVVPRHRGYKRLNATQKENLRKTGLRCQSDWKKVKLRIEERERSWQIASESPNNVNPLPEPPPPPPPTLIPDPDDDDRARRAEQLWSDEQARQRKGVEEYRKGRAGKPRRMPRPKAPRDTAPNKTGSSRPASPGPSLTKTDGDQPTVDESAISDTETETLKDEFGTDHLRRRNTSASTEATVGSNLEVQSTRELRDLVPSEILPQHRNIALPISSANPSIQPPSPSLPPAPSLRQSARRPVYLPRDALNKFFSIAQIDIASDRASWGLLLGVLRLGKTAEDAPQSFEVTSLLIPPQPRDPKACGSLTMPNVDLKPYIDGSHRLILGWIHSHPDTPSTMTSTDLHTHVRYQSVMAESFAIICARDTYLLARLTHPGLREVKTCKETSIFHEHLNVMVTDSKGKQREQAVCTSANHVQFTQKSIEVIDLRRDMVESFTWIDRPPSRPQRTTIMPKPTKGFTIMVLPPDDEEKKEKDEKGDEEERGRRPSLIKGAKIAASPSGLLPGDLRPLSKSPSDAGRSPKAPSANVPAANYKTRPRSRTPEVPDGPAQRSNKSPRREDGKPLPKTPKTPKQPSPLVNHPERQATINQYPAADLTGLVECNPRDWRAKGGFANVYEGHLRDRTSQDKAKVAVKMLEDMKNALFEDRSERLEKRLKREVRMWQILMHERVVKLLGFAYVDDFPCLISPWYSKGNMKTFLKDIPLESPIRTKFVRQVAEGLTYLHNQQPQAIIHGDIKAENVLINDAGDAMLGDFGLTQFLSDQDTGLTTSGAKLGSLRWCAPELFINLEHTISTDIYAYGSLALEALTGKVPFCNINFEPPLVSMILDGKIPQREFYPPFPGMDEMWKMFCECWRKDPNHRPTMQQIYNKYLPSQSP